MSEEKLYAVKNDEGKYWDFYNSGFWKPDIIDCIATPIKKQTELVIEYYGGHVVTLIEEPEKVAVPVWFDEFVQKYEDNLSNEEMARLRIIGKVCQSGWGTTFNSQLNRDIPDEFNPFDLDDYQLCYVNEHKDELVHALSLNSWTVVKEKKYNVKVPHTDDSYFYKIDDEYCNAGDSYHLEGMTDKKWFTDAEIEHYGLQNCERVEVKE